MALRLAKLGLALGGGAFRGLAHIGVLQVLRQEGIPVDILSGTSMGALIGAIYSVGADMDRIETVLYRLHESDLIDLVIPREGFLKGDRIQSVVKTLTKDKDFSQTLLPFACVATDLLTGDPVVLRSGKLHDAVRASISIPGIFVPHSIDGRLLVDGGVVNRVPIDVAREMGADVVVGVDVGYRGTGFTQPKGIFDVILHTTEMQEWEVLKARAMKADVEIIPQVAHINMALMTQSKECVELGRQAALLQIENIRHCLKKAQEKLDETQL